MPNNRNHASSKRQRYYDQKLLQQAHNNNSYALNNNNTSTVVDNEEGGGRMCGPAVLTRFLSRRNNEIQHIHDLAHHGMMSLEIGTDSTDDSPVDDSIPKFVGRGGFFSAADLEEIERDKKAAELSSSSKVPEVSNNSTLGTQELSRTESGNQSSPVLSTLSSPSPSPRFHVCVAEASDGQVVASSSQGTDDHDDNDDAIDERSLITENSLLNSMRNVLEQQQAALLDIAQQNQQFKSTLVAYQQEMKMLRDEAACQKIRLTQLTLQKEAVENESVYLKAKVTTLQNELEEKADLRKRFENLLVMDDGDDSTADESDMGGSFEAEIMNITPLSMDGGDQQQQFPVSNSEQQKHLTPYPLVTSPRAQPPAVVDRDSIEVLLGRTAGTFSPKAVVPRHTESKSHKTQDVVVPPRHDVADYKSRLGQVKKHRRERIGRHEI